MDDNRAATVRALLRLNDKERYLADFLRHNPGYARTVIGETDTGAYQALMERMKAHWAGFFPDRPFFLEGTGPYLREDFFIPTGENMAITTNLRYMPLILHSHQFIELSCVLRSGESAIVTPHGRQRLADGDIILSPPGYIHCFQTHDSESVIVDIFMRSTTFDVVFFHLLRGDNYLSALFTKALYGTGNGCILWHCRGDARLERLVLDALGEAERRERYSKNMLELLVMQFFLLLMRHHEGEAVFSTPFLTDDDRLFDSIHSYLCAHYQDITLTRLAERYNYSERQIIRLLKKHTGKGFSALLAEVRLNRAAQLLKNEDFSIAQIAKQLGYSSPVYFRKVFEKARGCPPEVYRRGAGGPER